MAVWWRCPRWEPRKAGREWRAARRRVGRPEGCGARRVEEKERRQKGVRGRRVPGEGERRGGKGDLLTERASFLNSNVGVRARYFFIYFYLFLFPDSAISPPILMSCSSPTEACNIRNHRWSHLSLLTTCTLTTARTL